MTGKNTKTAIPIALWGVPIALWAGIRENYKSGSPRSATGIPIALRESLRFGDQHICIKDAERIDIGGVSAPVILAMVDIHFA